MGVAGMGLTTMVIVFDVVGLPVTPGKLEVMMHLTTWPFVSVVVV